MGFWKKQVDAEVDDSASSEAASAPPRVKERGMAMLRREDSAAPGELNAVLGRGSSFEGKLTFEGTVRIEGTFKGEIHTEDTLVIGEGAHVEAEVSAGTVVVSGGEVIGNIRAKQAIELERAARVRGTLETPALKIEKGVVFVGSCKMDGKGEAKAEPGDGKVTSLAEKAAAREQEKKS
jgi:cytoskeletal protein CcmA (bactofilin family)